MIFIMGFNIGETDKVFFTLIQVTKSNFSTIATSMKVSPNDSNNDEWQPEIARDRKYLYLWDW